MKFDIADVVRFKPEHEGEGLFEVTGYDREGEVTLTRNECRSEFYAKEIDLLLVCSAEDRKDI